MSSGDVRSGWCLGCPGPSGSAWGCGRVGDWGWGSTPRPYAAGSARPGSASARDPAPPGVEAQRLWELEKEVRELGGGGAIRRGASALLPWRSVSARRADPRLHRGPEGGVGTHAGSALP